ncbi:39S ribosomal protein L37, mitochondrial isoform X2 [Copidosoma floridanum]|uniref:39S ribosomal protein L37, mitochondrial isoform X2 n=1 Tax=Copidosoma floridanum TaxID=29053 RepID=UPI0006C9D139|nr:39S ribosomal protein L37, mitochondrial isoform X2 [Copidosoma floridanum]
MASLNSSKNFFTSLNLLEKRPPTRDKNHPDWHDRPCLTYKDNDLLTLGLPQAQDITKTVVFENQLPEAVESLIEDIPEEYHNLAQKTIKTSVIFDAHQELLPKVKDPNRPAFNFPRLMGITDVRKISNLSKKLIQLCECINGPEVSETRSMLDNVLLSFPFEREFDLHQFVLTMDMMLMCEKPLTPSGHFNEEVINSMEIPNLHPLHCSIGLDEENIYKLNNFHPLVSGYHKSHIHTIIAYYDPSKVKHKSELSSTESQTLGRALLKAFTAAASSARQRFGLDVKELPEPITVQCIHSDGKWFYFSVYQLNTLDIEGKNGIKNYYWMLPKLDLYKVGGYVRGTPVLEGYNPEVLKTMLAFYRNN